MPQFPTYGLPQVETAPLPTVRFSPGAPTGAFGQGIGQAISQLGELGAWNAARMQHQDDENAAFDAFHSAMSAANVYLDGSGSVPGLYGRQGKAALGVTTEAKRMLAEIGRQAAQSLKTDNSRARFGNLWQQRSGTLETQVSHFEAQQRVVASNEIVGASKAQALRNVAANPDQDTVFDAKFNVVQTYRANGRSDLEIAEVFQEIEATAADNQVRTMIRQDPLGTAHVLLADDSPYAEQPLAWRESWAEQALTEFEQRSRTQRAEEERQRKVDNQREAKLAKELEKEGDALHEKGQLSMTWVEQNREHLTPTAHRHFLDLLTGQGEGITDTEGYLELYQQARDGVDVWPQARRMLEEKHLTQEDFNRLIGRSEKGPAMPHHIKYWERYLAGVFGDDAALVDFGSRQRKYDALAAYMEWWNNNPEATAQEAEAEARHIARSYSVVDMQKQLVSVTLPQHLVGTRMEPNLQATAQAIEQDFLSGKITQAQYDEEYIRLDQLDRLLELKKQLEEERSQAK